MDIIKIVGVIIKDGKYLVARDSGEDFFKNVGGRVEGDETDIDCLKRHLEKELGFKIDKKPELVFDFPPTPAEGDPGKSVVLRGYLISQDEEFNPVLSGDVGELAWIDADNKDSYKLTPQIKDLILPKLKGLKYIN